MDEGPEHSVWENIRRFFGYKESAIEEAIAEAKEEGELKTEEVSMLLNVLQLNYKQAKEIMVPRTDMICAERNSSLAELTKIMIDSGHSRIPIYKENKDNIIGLVHSKDLLKLHLQSQKEQSPLEKIVRPVCFIPDTKPVKNILLDFQTTKTHLTIVVDEYGGTSGLITLEDVLEEIVGEIEDEYDLPKHADIHVKEDKTILVTGRTLLEDLEEECGIHLDSDKVETIGGFVCELAGRVPLVGEKFSTETVLLEIERADSRQIHSILLTPVKNATP